MWIERARAKINLTLHVPRRREDGWHEIESLVAFAGVADTLTLSPGPTLTLAVEGPGAEAAGADDDNLVLRAARHLQQRVEGLRVGAFHLTKRLPVAAGVGGGSADAGAALRLLARATGMAADDARLFEAARATGADVPVCLGNRARVMRGVGDELGEPVRLPPLYAMLVNPQIALPTHSVFAKLALAPGQTHGFSPHPVIASGVAFAALASLLRNARNDLEDPAGVLASVIVDVLAAIGAARGCKLTRMSGSGATCYGLFETRHGALTAAKTVRRAHAGWWVCATVLR